MSSIYGPYFFGTMVSTTFYGFTCAQTFFYYVHYRNDPLRIRILVATIWAVNTIHQALIVSGAYKYFMACLMDPSAVLNETTESVLQILPTNVAAVLTQGFLVHRIYNFSKKNIAARLNWMKYAAPLFWLCLGFLQTVTVTIYVANALYSTKSGVHADPFNVLDQSLFVTLGTICLSTGAVEDAIIAIVTTFLLVQERTVAHFARTAHVLQRLTVFAVNTGIWSATFALMTVVFMHAFSFSSDVVYVVFLIPLCPVYCNTLLANLNAREYIKGEEVDYLTTSALLRSSTTTSDKRSGWSQLLGK